MDEPEVTVRRVRRAGHRGPVAEVLLRGEFVGSVFPSGTTPPAESTELWCADAVEDANVFLTEQEAIARTVSQARRRGHGHGRPA